MVGLFIISGGNSSSSSIVVIIIIIIHKIYQLMWREQTWNCHKDKCNQHVFISEQPLISVIKASYQLTVHESKLHQPLGETIKDFAYSRSILEQ